MLNPKEEDNPPLGDLRFLRLWHDNRGRGDSASWYCDFVCVIDLQTKNRFNFIVEKWFGVDEGDGLVDRVIPVAGPIDRLRVYYIFSHKVKSDASDNHLWASIFTRPAHSRFTRVERVACCLLILFLTMVSSCMFYRNEGPEVVDFEFTIGPFALTPYVAYTGAVTCLITFVPVTLIMLLFRNSKLRVSHTTLLRGVVEDHLDEELEDDDYENTIRENGPQLHHSAGIDQPRQSYSETPELSEKEIEEKGKESLKSKLGDISFPWQMRILAWFLLIGAIAASVVFTTFYGISFGDAACKQWLSSLFVSFFMDLCLTQPIKVILFAIFFAVIFRGRIENYVIRPPDPETLERARIHRQKTRQMFDMLRELLFFVVFFTLLVIVSNGFRDPMAMRLRESLTSLFFNGDDFINSIDGIWNWLEKVLLPNLRAGKWYNGMPPIGQRGFIGDRMNRIMGYATMRQVRVREGWFF
ncbi:unnamed protein product [Rodentolepis nana]|uniref:PLAT domain-containing protein n=1 Tax=Rodentolepis nana TaxID=102285 RepID=A0A3P7TAT2_RODNA|nr:unnamed protein product [Rodentolepis nana]